MINNHYSTDIQLFKNALNLLGTSQEITVNNNKTPISKYRISLSKYGICVSEYKSPVSKYKINVSEYKTPVELNLR